MTCKVEQTVARFDIGPTGEYGDVDEELLARWRGVDGYEELGYRALTSWFNRRVLKQVYDRNGRKTLGIRVKGDYEALTGDDEFVREEVLDDLRADGIEAMAVADGLVSWSTMRHHLKGCLDGNKQYQASDSDWERESVRIATDQAVKKAESAVGSLASKGELIGGDEAAVSAELYLTCPECNLRVSLLEARARGYICTDHLGGPEDGDETAKSDTDL